VSATLVCTFQIFRRNVLRPFVSTALLVTAAGLPLHAKDLPTALTELLKSHPRIQEAEKQALAAGQDIRDADSGFLPKVSVTGDAGIETIDSPSRRDVTPEHSNMRRDSSTLTLTQNLFDGFATSSQSTIASLGQTRAEANLETVRQAVLFDGIAAYLDVLRTTELLKVAARNERTITTCLAPKFCAIPD
jgi:outer membrane protein, adhesin transport system